MTKTLPKAKPLGHCWHHTGNGITYGMSGGEDQHRCCYCGAIRSFTRINQHRAVEGHGPYETFTTIIYEFAYDPCPARRAGAPETPK